MSHPCDKILVVDDDDALREAICDVLTDQGVNVMTAGSAERALEILAEGFAPNVILLDLLMPGMGVEEMLDTLRSNQQYADIPVVLSTGTPRLFTRNCSSYSAWRSSSTCRESAATIGAIRIVCAMIIAAGV